MNKQEAWEDNCDNCMEQTYRRERMSRVMRLSLYGTNSTLFTLCCKVAICSDQKDCPVCGEEVDGYDPESRHKTEMYRWQDATRHWNRRAEK